MLKSKRADAAYLAGMIDGEGCVSWHTGGSKRVRITNTDRDLLQRCAACCDTLGITYRFYLTRPPREDWSPAWEMDITGRNNLERVFVEVPLGTRKREKLEQALAGYKPRHTPPSADKLRSLYTEQTIYEMAVTLSVSPSTVRRWMDEAGVLRGTGWEHRSKGTCTGCGKPYDQRTPGCSNCKSRHWQRAHYERIIA